MRTTPGIDYTAADAFTSLRAAERAAAAGGKIVPRICRVKLGWLDGGLAVPLPLHVDLPSTGRYDSRCAVG